MSLCYDCKYNWSCGIAQTSLKQTVNDYDAFSLKNKLKSEG